MANINLIPDDLAVQALRSQNARHGTAEAVTPVDPYPAQQAGQPRSQSRPPHLVARDNRRGDRRKEDRRKKQVPVILDTRTPHNRRRIGDRRQDVTDETPAPVPLNLYA